MLHPTLSRALADAHIEDLHRAAAQRRMIRLAHRVTHAPHVAATPIAILRSAATRLRGSSWTLLPGLGPTRTLSRASGRRMARR
jgi:hypothetical protein